MARPLLGRAFEDATVGHRLAVAGCARLGAYATVTVASKLAFPDARYRDRRTMGRLDRKPADEVCDGPEHTFEAVQHSLGAYSAAPRSVPPPA